MGAPRPWRSATLGTATAAGGAGGAKEGGTAAGQGDTGVRGEGRATEEGGETGEGRRKEKTASDDKVVTPVAQRSWVPGALGQGGA